MLRFPTRWTKRSLRSANEVAQRREAVTEMKRRLEIERARMEDMKASEEQQIRINEDQIASLKLIIAEQEKKLASLRVGRRTRGPASDPRQSAARDRAVRAVGPRAGARRSAGPPQGRVART